ncbi:hypothetical protein HY441_01415 [Candidatus Microgenomates bacterium]|nr:hypothetical protein [Candidatus Microgenomates bacterium]
MADTLTTSPEDGEDILDRVFEPHARALRGRALENAVNFHIQLSDNEPQADDGTQRQEHAHLLDEQTDISRPDFQPPRPDV